MKRFFKNIGFCICSVWKACPGYFIINIGLSVLTNGIIVFNVVALKILMHSLEVQENISEIIYFLLFMLVILIIQTLCNAFIIGVLKPINLEKIHKKIQMALFRKAFHMDLKYYDNSDFYNKFYFVIQQSEKKILSVVDALSNFIGCLVGISGLAAIVLSYDFFIIFVVLLSLIISTLLNTKISRIKHNIDVKAIQVNRNMEYVQRVFYLKEYAKEIKLYNFFSLFNQFFSESTEKKISIYKNLGGKNAFFSAVQGILKSICDVIILMYLSIKVLAGLILVSEFLVVYTGAQQLSSQIGSLILIIPNLYENSLYIDDLKKFVNIKSKSNYARGIKVDKVKEICINNLSFAYEKNEKCVLLNINMKIRKGEKVAIVGYNGAGKSTLVKLIANLYSASSGEIYINRINICDISLESLYEHISIVFQDYQIFAFSIAENILMRKIYNIEEDRRLVEEALKFVGLYDKVMSLEKDIYTNLSKEFNEKGTVFSGGEYQKIALARAYARKGDILILDEPSSAFDPVSENEIYKLMMKMAKDKIVIFISHQLANIKNVDKIYYIEDGIVFESGSHEELMERNGHYAHMYNLQRSKY